MKKRLVLAPLVFALLPACGASPGESPLDELGSEIIGENYFSTVNATPKTSLTAAEGTLSSGTLDWAHFTSTTTANGGSFDGIKNFKRIGTGPFGQIPTGPLAFSWTGGSPTFSASDVRSHVRTCGAGSGLSFEVPATGHTRKLRVFVGAHNAAAYFVAWRGGEGRTAASLIQSASGGQFGYYDLTYSSKDPGTIVVELKVMQTGSTPVTLNSCVSLLAATLVEPPNTVGTVSLENQTPTPLQWQSMHIAVNASHPSGVRGVELFYDNVKEGEDRTQPYEFNPIVKPGIHMLHAEVTTLAGTSFKSQPIYVNGWYRLDNGQSETIPDVGGWVEGPLSPVTPVSGKSVQAAMALVYIDHTYDQDLQIKLVSPNDKAVMLSQNNGGAGHDYKGTWFYDNAPLFVTRGSAPFTGDYKPQELLSAMNGQPFVGAKPWRLSIKDDYANDVGTVNLRMLWLQLD